ncbi:MAG: glyoxylate/hydroxypyruvate reductase A [Rhodocyclaceae bacterium]|nr:glyoxylate/hydroxypyruvate reductase A [Rhodocyclaceae bacterium]
MSLPVIPFVDNAGERTYAAWVAALQAAMPDERIVGFRQLGAADKNLATLAIVANPDPADLRQLPQLRWVHSVWAGVERLVADLGDTPLQIVRLVDPQMAETMAEAALAWTLYLHRDMPAYARQQRSNTWRALPHVRPENRRVGLLGLGSLGAASAQRLLAAGFRVSGWSRTPKSLPGIASFAGADGLAAMLRQTDILICLLPLTAQTRGLLDRDALARLPQGAALINFARGPIVVDADLRAALDSGHLDHAVLDVFDAEPLPVEQWHWQHPRVTVLPHCTAQTDLPSAAAIVAAAVRRYRKDGIVPGNVDPGRGY